MPGEQRVSALYSEPIFMGSQHMLWQFCRRHRHLVDLGPRRVYRSRHGCVDAVLHHLTQARFVAISGEPRFYSGDRIGEDARCSDAVFASCLATHPDAFDEPFPPRGVWPTCSRSEDPSLSQSIRRPSATRFVLENCFLSKNYKSPFQFRSFSRTFHVPLGAHVPPLSASNPLAVASRSVARASLR